MRPVLAQGNGFLGPDTLGCDSIVLSSTVSGDTYLWSNGDSTATTTVSQGGIYWLKVMTQLDTVSDTIAVMVETTPQPLTPADTTVCGQGLVSLTVNADPGTLISWYDQATGSTAIAIGSVFGVDASSDTTVYVEAFSSVPTAAGLVDTLSNGLISNNPNNRGLVFDVLSPCVLGSVTVYRDDTTSFEIRLLDSSQQVIAQQAVSLTAPGSGGLEAATVALEFPLSQGNGYRLVATGFSGPGVLALQFPFGGYPLVDQDSLLQIRSAENGSVAVYPFFYDWQLSRPVCGSGRIPYQIQVLPTPEVNLPNDTLVCGDSLNLDATFPGASYLWSTGDTTASITLDSSKMVSVEANIGTCSSRDTAQVFILSIPLPPVTSDTSICGPGLISLTPDSLSEGFLVWYVQAIAGDAVFSGPTATFDILNDSTVYVESFSTVPSSAGLGDTLSNGLISNNPNNRGLVFDVLSPCVLDSVTVYHDDATNFEVRLLDSSQQVIAQQAISLTTPGSGSLETAIVALEFPLSQGNGYRLVATDFTGPGALALQFPFSGYPLLSQDSLLRINGAENGSPTVYPFFYDWQLSRPVCGSGRVPYQIQVLPTPEVDLPNDTLVCGDSLSLDASFPGASYLWSTGDTTASITLDSSKIVAVSASIGNCVERDTTKAFVLPVPSVPTVVDTAVCGPGLVELTADTATGDFLIWYDQPQGGEAIAVGQGTTLAVNNDRVVYAESFASYPAPAGLKDTTVGTVIFSNNNNRGLSFDVFDPIRLDSVTVYHTGALTMLLRVLDMENEVLLQQVYTLPNTGGMVREAKLAIGISLRPQADYKLIAFSLTGPGNLALQFPFSAYPVTNSPALSVTASSTGSAVAYFYFYDWQISLPACGSGRVPFQAEVALPLRLQDSLYACSDTAIALNFPAEGYLWSTGDTTNQLLISQTGTYTVTVSDNQGCVVSDTIFVEIPVDAGLPNDGILCGTVLTTNYDTTAIHLWSTGDTTATLTIADTGIYSVIVDEPRGCTLTDTISVTGFDEFPAVDLGADLVVCDSVLLDAGNPGLDYAWSTGDTTQTIFARSSGLYTATVINANDCATTDTVGVNITLSPTASFSAVPNGLQVSFINTSPNLANTYFWTFGDGDNSTAFGPSHTYDSAGTYLVTLVIGNECGLDTFQQSVSVSTTSVPQPGLPVTWRVYPNPAQRQFWVEGANDPGNEIDWRLIDLTGRTLAAGRELAESSGQQRWSIDVSRLPEGFYWLVIQDQHGHLQARLTLQLMNP